MSLVPAAWFMMSGACFAIGLVHLVIWLRRRREPHILMFGVSAIAITVLAVCEVAMMTAASVEEMVRWLRFGHVPVFFVLCGLVAFVQFFFGTGRWWLAAGVIALRAGVLLASFLSEVNANYVEIVSLGTVELLGESVTVIAEGVINPWTRLASFSLVLFIVYVTDASIRLWRKGDPDARRRAVLVGGGIILTLTFAGVTSTLKHEGVAAWPYINAPAYLFILIAIGLELAVDMLRAADLARRLSLAEQRIELAARGAGFGIWEWEPVSGALWLSETARALLGFEADETVTAERFFGTLLPEDARSIREDIERAHNVGGEIDTVARIAGAKAQGGWVALRGSALPHSDERKRIVVRGVISDVSARRQAELELARQRSELAHLARVAAMGELSGPLAHELNQPLTAILSNAQAAQQMQNTGTLDEATLAEILQDVADDAKRAGEVIRRLRSLIRRGEVERVRLDINAVIADVLRLVRNDLMARRVQADTELAFDLPPVWGDRIQLQQVVLNLVLNACDAMDAVPRPCRVLVRSERTAEGGIRVAVADQGCGIAPEQVGRMFEPFFTTKERGLGLGLSVCRTIVEQHGGAIEARNNAGGGATLRFTLPAAAAVHA
jgi:signal transduction histidine kinase